MDNKVNLVVEIIVVLTIWNVYQGFINFSTGIILQFSLSFKNYVDKFLTICWQFLPDKIYGLPAHLFL